MKYLNFPVTLQEIQRRTESIDPIKYAKTRNFSDGATTALSPYISRGVIATKYVFNAVLNRGYNAEAIEKFVQELAWRDYWQQVWLAKGEYINSDIKSQQQGVIHYQMPSAILRGCTSIEAVDEAIALFYQTGYLHNHMRLYIAALACNICGSHWRLPAQWMYYHLLDADWASNALSWQWVAGSNSNKKYYMNQDSINKYFYTTQKNTFLDVDYAAFATMLVPAVMTNTIIPELKTPLPAQQTITVNTELPTCLYNLYNLDPQWKQNISANRILLLEPSHFLHYPVSEKTIDFVIKLSRNIANIRVYVGEFDELIHTHRLTKIYYKEHPLNKHYRGIEESRDWMFDVKGYYPSFFSFWRQCKKILGLRK